MILSKDQIKVIADHPLKDGLEDVRNSLRKATDPPPDGLIASLLGALILSSAAYNLFPTGGRENLASYLLRVRQNLREISLETL